jgi:hypothetical protein
MAEKLPSVTAFCNVPASPLIYNMTDLHLRSDAEHVEFATSRLGSELESDKPLTYAAGLALDAEGVESYYQRTNEKSYYATAYGANDRADGSLATEKLLGFATIINACADGLAHPDAQKASTLRELSARFRKLAENRGPAKTPDAPIRVY